MWHHEMQERFRDATARWTAQGDVTVHRPQDVAAPGRCLLHRAADVTLKERRRLVIVPREAPLSIIHLRNLVTLAEAGATVLPPVPAFYLRPSSIADIVAALVDRMLHALGVIESPADEHRWA